MGRIAKYTTYAPFMAVMEVDAYESLTKRLALIQERVGLATQGEALTWWIRMIDAVEVTRCGKDCCGKCDA